MESVLSLKNRVGELLVAKGSSDDAVVALGVERDSLKGTLAARDAELENVQIATNAKSQFAELLKESFGAGKHLVRGVNGGFGGAASGSQIATECRACVHDQSKGPLQVDDVEVAMRFIVCRPIGASLASS